MGGWEQRQRGLAKASPTLPLAHSPIRFSSFAACPLASLQLDDINQLFDGFRRLMERPPLFQGQPNLDNLFKPAGS